MPTRTARTAWNGNLQEGSGQVELSSSKVGTYDVSFPKRAADDAGGTTSPEEMIAAAHSSCYAMQCSAIIAENGGFKLTGIKITVSAEVEGLDESGFQKAAETAKAGCPVSKALAAVDISLEASLS